MTQFLTPFFRPRASWRALKGYRHYLRDWLRYRALPGAEALTLRDALPMLSDRTSYTPFDKHYFYQEIWAATHIRETGASVHVDVGSWIGYAGLLTAFTSVIFVDIRPLQARLPRFVPLSGSILSLPFADGSVDSLSCLHVAEHIGLGRYGDPLDPAGTRAAAHELARILKPGGNLYFSLPVGTARVQFNAHRIHSPAQILSYFESLELVSFSAVDDHGDFRAGIDPAVVADSRYACGCFHFTRRTPSRAL